jgi:hypothetical protein
MEWHLAEELAPGQHHVVLLVDDPAPTPEQAKGTGILSLPPIDWGFSGHQSFRREELYAGDGRI